MKQQVFFRDLDWQVATPILVQGIKGGRIPHYAVGGSNGSFIVAPPSKLILKVESANGKRYAFDIASIVKSCNNWTRLTEKRVHLIENRFELLKEIFIEDNQIQNLTNIISL